MKFISSSERPVLYTQGYILLFVAHLFFGLSFWPYVLLPVFLQDLGADLLMVGVIMAMASFSGTVLRPWVGTALDRIGRKKCLFAGGLVFFISHLLYLQVDEIGWFIYCVRLFHGFGMGILMATLFTLAADLSPVERKTEGIAIFGVAGHLSGALGVPMGEQIIQWGGYTGLFWTCAGLSLVLIAFGFRIQEPRFHDHAEPPLGFFKISLFPSIRLPLLATIAFGVSLTGYMVFLKPYAQSIGITSVTPFFVAYTLTAIGVRLVGAHWPDRFGLKPVLYPAMVSLALGIFLLIFLPTVRGMMVSGFLCGIGHGFIFPILSVMVIGNGRTSDQGSLMTIFTMFLDVGLLIGPPLLGFIARGSNFTPMFLSAGLIQIGTLALFLILNRKMPQPEELKRY